MAQIISLPLRKRRAGLRNYFDTLDLLVICAGSFTEIDFANLPKIMTVGGKIVCIGVPKFDEKVELTPFSLMGTFFGGSATGSPQEIGQLLDLVSEKKIKPWVEKVPISEEGLATVYDKMNRGDEKYRFTMVDYDKYFGN